MLLFLLKKLYSHCSSLPSCINDDLVSTVEIAHSCNCNINGYLGMEMPTGIAAGRLWVPTPSFVRHGTGSCQLLVLPQEDLLTPTLIRVGTSKSSWGSNPMLAPWVGMNTECFAFVCMCVCMQMLHICTHTYYIFQCFTLHMQYTRFEVCW